MAIEESFARWRCLIVYPGYHATVFCWLGSLLGCFITILVVIFIFVITRCDLFSNILFDQGKFGATPVEQCAKEFAELFVDLLERCIKPRLNGFIELRNDLFQISLGFAEVSNLRGQKVEALFGLLVLCGGSLFNPTDKLELVLQLQNVFLFFVEVEPFCPFVGIGCVAQRTSSGSSGEFANQASRRVSSLASTMRMSLTACACTLSCAEFLECFFCNPNRRSFFLFGLVE